MSSSPSTIRIAILGGGISAAALLRGLLRHSHVAVDIYNPQPQFKEEGQGVAVTPVGEEILNKLDPSLDAVLDRIGAFQSYTELRVASGQYAGESINFPGRGRNETKTIERQAFLDALMKDTPPRSIHRNSRIATVTEALNGAVVIAFADGTEKKYDVVVGADGLHGITRKFVLGVNESSLQPQHTGIWGLTLRVPYDKAREAMGDEFLDINQPLQMSWIGNGTIMQHHLTGEGKGVYLAAYARHSDCASTDPWAKVLTPEEFGAVFSQSEVPACQGMVKLIQSVYTVQVAAICQMRYAPAKTYVKKNVALIGDAAHSTIKMQGTSITTALEEAYILSTLLGEASSKDAIPAALQAFDEVCRPRAEDLARHVADCGLVMTGAHPDIGLDPFLLGQQLQIHWEVIRDSNVQAQHIAAINKMNQLLAERSPPRSS
ncbi:FAD/NAD(P)-binding domain-containing protein [Xylariaceae sp. FL1019]|nr:FAD/NAD(P)-binding domain-containing protein [Xylariaceae sp. FL1019]